MRTQLANDGDQCAHGLALVSVAEPLPATRLRAHHPGITPPAGAAQVGRPADAERVQRGGQLADPVAAQLIGVVDGQLRPLVADDLTLLAERAGDDLHLRPAPDIVGDGDAVGDGLVVGMGMHEQQPRSFLHGTHPTVALRGNGFRGLNR